MKEKQGDNEGSWSGGTSKGFASPVSLLRITQSGIGARYDPRRGVSLVTVGETISQISLVSLFIGRKLFALEFSPPWAGGRRNDGVN